MLSFLSNPDLSELVFHDVQVYWLFNNEPVVSPDYQISSTGDTYSLYIPEVFDEDAGRFSVTAENDSGKATCSALLVIVDEEAGMGEIGSPPETPIAKQMPSGPFKHDYVKVSGGE
jgi:hypothetical protein